MISNFIGRYPTVGSLFSPSNITLDLSEHQKISAELFQLQVCAVILGLGLVLVSDPHRALKSRVYGATIFALGLGTMIIEFGTLNSYGLCHNRTDL